MNVYLQNSGLKEFFFSFSTAFKALLESEGLSVSLFSSSRCLTAGTTVAHFQCCLRGSICMSEILQQGQRKFFFQQSKIVLDNMLGCRESVSVKFIEFLFFNSQTEFIQRK